jgi:two-component system NtrC family sensor kinase
LILEQARRAISITRQIGNFAMPQSLHRELLDLNALVRNTASFVTFDSRFHRVKINLDLDPALPAVSCVADHLTQVVMNVLINAGDALQDRYDAPPVIRVSTAMRDTAAVLEIEDNGTGIRPELLNRVFDEYFTTKAPGKGIGLGLSLCRRLIQESGGDISIQSNVGQGTMITVSLPVTSDSIG